MKPHIFSFLLAFALMAAYQCHAFGTTHQLPKSSLRIRPTVVSWYKTQLNVEGSKIAMPALSSTMKEGRVVSWLKSEGEAISAGEAIMVVESDKADMDVEAFEDGFLAKIIVGEGQTAPVGEAVAWIAVEESAIAQVIESFSNDGNGGEDESYDPISESKDIAVPSVPFSQIDMPALSSTMKEGKVVNWLKAEGDAISAGEAIMVVESDKADMDVEAFEDGFLAAIITREGESGLVGAPVALIAENKGDISSLKEYAEKLAARVGIKTAAAVASTPATVPKSGTSATTPRTLTSSAISAVVNAGTRGDRVVASPLARKKAEERGINLSFLVGSGPDGRITASDVEAAISGTAFFRTITSKTADGTSIKSKWIPAPGVMAATPTARQLSKKAKLDLKLIAGTGEFGRVTADDVRAAMGEKKPVKKVVSQSCGGAQTIEFPEGIVPFTGMQRAVSNNMVATLATPEFRVTRDIEMDAFDDLYQMLKPKGVSVSAMLAKAVALSIQKHPIINSSYDDKNGGGIRFNKDINIAMAVAIEGGLVTPTLMYANERSSLDLANNWKELVGKARRGSLSPSEYNSGTFTISNMGMFGVTHFGAILPKGMGGILAVGATQETIVPCKQSVLGMKKVKKMSVTLTCDHRQIYGADAALFLKTLADIMENKLDLIAA